VRIEASICDEKLRIEVDRLLLRDENRSCSASICDEKSRIEAAQLLLRDENRSCSASICDENRSCSASIYDEKSRIEAAQLLTSICDEKMLSFSSPTSQSIIRTCLSSQEVREQSGRACTQLFSLDISGVDQLSSNSFSLLVRLDTLYNLEYSIQVRNRINCL